MKLLLYFHKNCLSLFFYNLGSYQINIKLLKGLFPDGEDLPPKLQKTDNQGWVLNHLALCYGMVGQASHAESVLRIALPLAEKENNRATALDNLSRIQLKLGKLKAAEESIRSEIGLRENGDPFFKASALLQLSTLLAYCGDFVGSRRELELANWLNDNSKSKKFIPGTIFVYRTIINKIAFKEDAKYISLALRTARKALQLSKSHAYEPVLIEIKLLLASAILASFFNQGLEPKELLEDAENFLQEATVSCHNINMVDQEPDILIAWSYFHLAKGNYGQARTNAEDALYIADRCEYRLKQAEIHNFLARLAIKEKNFKEAKIHALSALTCAECDGKPHYYKLEFDEARSILTKLGTTA
jgi:hypothetical protein